MLSEPTQVEQADLAKRVEQFLFGRGQALRDYWIEQTPFSQMLGFRNAAGVAFDLPISDADLRDAVLCRLKALGVLVVRLG